jgi:hypothetical protein
LDEEERKKYGITAGRVLPTKQCRSEIDWTSSQAYVGINDCDDAYNTEVLRRERGGMMTFLSSTPFEAAAAQAYISDRANAHLFTNYIRGWPKPALGTAGPGTDITCHRVPVIGDVSYATRSFSGDGWMGWRMEKVCPTDSVLSELAFAFGFRVFFPVTVTLDEGFGSREVKRTVIVEQGIAPSATSAYNYSWYDNNKMNRLAGRILVLLLSLADRSQALAAATANMPAVKPAK